MLYVSSYFCRKLLKHLGATAFFIEDIDELGIVLTMKKALEAINPKYAIYITL
jgi:arginase family enzyme